MFKLLEIVWLIPLCVDSIEFSLEAEVFGHPPSIGDQQISLNNGETLKIPFCLRADSSIKIYPQLIGEEHAFDIKIDGQLLSWNRPPNRWSTEGTNLTFLQRGRHIIKLSPHQLNIDIDKVRFYIDDNYLTEAQFTCDVFCLPEIPRHNAFPVETLPSAKVVQRSFDDACAESKNIWIDFYHETVKKFRITAQNPSYRSLLNARLADRNNCFRLLPNIWEFTNLDVVPQVVDDEPEEAVLEIKEAAGGCSMWNVYFNISKWKHDINVSAIGGSLQLEIQNHKSDVHFQIKFKIKNEEHLSRKYTIPSGQNKLDIAISDYTWSRLNNEVDILACGDGNLFSILSLKLTRRELKKDQGETIYDDGELLVERVKHDMWWMGSPGMEISVKGNDDTTTTNYIRVYTRVPWGGYSQNFVIYQDGVIRLLPPTTHGADWIPFGTFLLSGRFEPSNQTTSAKVTKIWINPEKLELVVTYGDGSKWLYKLNIGFEKTEVVVEVIESPEQLSTLPFLQLRSMFIEDGYSNVDRLSVDGMPEHRILDDWSNLYGSSFFFYRGCISGYHTQSPDTHVQLLE